jgi:putative thioredoxin
MSQIPPPSLANLRGAVDLSSLVRPPATQATTGAAGSLAGRTPGPGTPSAAVPVPALVLEVTDQTLTAILDLSKSVPVIVEFYGRGATTALASVVEGYGGRLVLARVDAAANPQMQQAFQAEVVPTVFAVIAGRPLPLFEGDLPEPDLRDVLEQVLGFAAQNQVVGTATVPDAPVDQTEPVEEPLPPHHQDAFDAIERGDYPAAITAYRTAIAQDPRDRLAVAGLAQVSLLERLAGATAADIRSAAADAPRDAAAQLAVADLDVSGGHLEDAFDRLLTLFPSLLPDDRNEVRTRLLDYFEIAGVDDARVIAARRRLTALLY